MVAGLTWVALCAVSVGFSAGTETESKPSLRDEIRVAMRDTLPSQGAIDDAEARRLLALFERLTVDDTLGEKERGRLLDSLRRRLITAAEQAHARAERAEQPENEVTTVALPPDTAPILAQQQPAVPPPAAATAAPPNAPQDSGDDLARLIVATIAPESWEQNGGNGSIYYYRQWQCLVVRQTDGVHQRLGRLAAALRQP